MILGMRKRYAAWAAVTAVVLLAILSVRLLSREETLEQAARKCMAYLDSRDFGGLLRYTRADEIQELELDEAKLSSLVDEFYLPSLRGFKPVGADRLEFLGGPAILSVQRTLAHSDGRTVVVDLSVTPTPAGPKLYNLSADIALSALRTYWPKGMAPPSANAVLLWDDAYSKALPELQKLSLRRVAFHHQQGIVSRTWEEMAARWSHEALKIKRGSTSQPVGR